MKSLTNILERITLTKEDISGMIREARKSVPGDQVIIQGNYLNGRFPELEMEDIRTLSKLFNSMSKSIVAQDVSEEDADDIISNAITDINNNRFSIIDFPLLKGSDANILSKTINNMKSFILDQGFTKDESNRIVTKTVNDIFNGKAQEYARGAEPGRDRSNKDPFRSAEAFEAFIKERYLSENQSISGLDALYNKIILNDISGDLIKLITSETNKSLKSGEYTISDTEGELYDILKRTVKIDNGHESELWFAIVFKGLVIGAKGDTPDVLVNGKTVSLKAYGTSTFDFGTLDNDSSRLLSIFISLCHLLTPISINPVQLSKLDINKALDLVESDEVKKDIKEILKLSESPSIPRPIAKLALQIKRLLNSNNDKDLHNLVVQFCNDIDILLEAKIKDANWWGLIVTSNKTLYLNDSESVFNSIRCKNNRLSDAIAHFKGYHLWIKGTQLETAVTTRKSKA